MIEDDTLLLRVAKDYYQSGQTLAEIGEELGCSTTHVGRLLAAARDKKLVEFSFRESAAFAKLENRLRKSYPHLQRIVIVPDVDMANDNELSAYARRLESMAQAASVIFQELTDPTSSSGNRKIGLGGGRSIFEMIARLPTAVRRNVDFYALALLGRGAGSNEALDPQTLVTCAWARSGMVPHRAHFVTIPPYFGNVLQSAADVIRACELLAAEPYIAPVIEEARTIDAAFFTVGALQHEMQPTDRYGLEDINRYFSTLELLEDIHVDPVAMNRAAAGEVCYSFFDDMGNELRDHRYFLSLGADHFRQMVQQKKSCVMIAGSYKIRAVKAALRGKLCNIWITDETGARQIANSAS